MTLRVLAATRRAEPKTLRAMTRPSWVATVAAIVAWAPSSPGDAQQTVHEGDVQGALLLAGGAVAVADGERVLLYPPSGASAAVIDGPFARVTRLVPAPDGGLAVWDDSLWAAFAFAEDGGVGDVLRFPKPGPGGGEVDFLAWLPGETGGICMIGGHKPAYSPWPHSVRPLRRLAGGSAPSDPQAIPRWRADSGGDGFAASVCVGAP